MSFDFLFYLYKLKIIFCFINKNYYLLLCRWHCKACGYLSVNRNALLQHIGKNHNYEDPNYEPLSPDNAIEDWVCLFKLIVDSILSPLLFIENIIFFYNKYIFYIIVYSF